MPSALRIPVAGASFRLEGRLHEDADSAAGWLALVAPPHPLYGGSIDNEVVHALVAAQCAAGRATLAFNFRGVGASEGTPSADLSQAASDYVAAARAVEGRVARWLSGYSFGSCAALRAALELGAEQVLLVAPPLGMLDRELLCSFRGRVAAVVGEDDDYCSGKELRLLMAQAKHGKVEVLEGVDHFFSGSGVRQLREALPRLTA
jgi:alpha/beta superfamily hydrolase